MNTDQLVKRCVTMVTGASHQTLLNARALLAVLILTSSKSDKRIMKLAEISRYRELYMVRVEAYQV